MSSITVTCPQTTRAENHKITTGQYWADPVYQAIAAKRIEGQSCEYCGRPAEVAHHDNADSYKSRKEYYKPENMIPLCNRCHSAYRRGLIICPECRQHYMRRTSEKCGHCRGDFYPYQKRADRASGRHPCAHRIGQQRCQRDGRVFVCARPPRTAAGCDHYQDRVKA